MTFLNSDNSCSCPFRQTLGKWVPRTTSFEVSAFLGTLALGCIGRRDHGLRDTLSQRGPEEPWHLLCLPLLTDWQVGACEGKGFLAAASPPSSHPILTLAVGIHFLLPHPGVFLSLNLQVQSWETVISILGSHKRKALLAELEFGPHLLSLTHHILLTHLKGEASVRLGRLCASDHTMVKGEVF